MTKHIFITGGVVSSLGKGLTSASLGMLLESHGISVRMQKLDPYLNVDPGTMSPYQHGEVYVLDDGSETDLDLGHYERFTQSPLTKNSSWTTGRIYQNVIERERRGEYHGKTVQVVPHVTDEIKRAIRCLEADDVDVVLTEIGGTVGDMESLPFLEAIRQLSLDLGRENCIDIHITLIPYLRAADELKTKPTQHSVGKLREIGIQPDFLVCRTEHDLSINEIEKIALFCNMSVSQVIMEKDCELSIYEVPLLLVKQGFDRLVIDRLHLPIRQTSDISRWYDILRRLQSPRHEVCVAVVGKYAKHKDAYKSIYESLDHAGINNSTNIRIKRIESDSLNSDTADRTLQDVDGMLIPGGFGERGIEGKISAIRFARENSVPFFGICLGMQCAVIEFARHVAGLENANSTEFDAETPHPVISLLAEQRNVALLGGTMRLGKQPAILAPGTRSMECYKTCEIAERHRHRYEFNNAYRLQLTDAGLCVAGTSPLGTLVEVVEIPSHPWFVGVQFHPEFQSQPTAPHPLFDGFINAAIQRQQKYEKSKFSTTASENIP